MMGRFQRFMSGRRGVDQLSVALVVLGCLITAVLSILRYPLYNVPFFRFGLYRLLGLLPMACALWRTVSTNLARRQVENDAFMKYWRPVRNRGRVILSHLRDRDHRYFRCPTCRRTLRVPKNRGKIEISCPHCGTKFKRRT